MKLKYSEVDIYRQNVIINWGGNENGEDQVLHEVVMDFYGHIYITFDIRY